LVYLKAKKNYIQEDGIFLNGLFGFYVSLASG
jgi:hypothetical protein